MKPTQIKIILSFILFAIAFSACEKIKIPKDVKSIDWRNYNDVYDVFWNYYTLCSEIKKGDEDKIIKVYGWIYPQWGGGLILGDRPNKVNEREYPWIDIRASVLATELQAKLDTCDLTKKCFVEGKLTFNELYTQLGCKSVPEIIIENTDDIYFK
jgi:hypothetical protein